MEIQQTAKFINDVTKEVLGESGLIVSEDLSNIIDLGKAIFNANSFDKYVKALVDHIGRVTFVNRPYSGRAPRVLMDAFEYGCVLEKIRINKLPEAEENETWELEDGVSYDPNIFYKPQVAAKFFNKYVTYEVPMSFTTKQVKSAFSNATQLSAFIAMIETAIDNSLTLKFDALIMRTIANMAAETVYDDYNSEGIETKSGVKAVNLLKLYNDKFTQELSAEAAITDPAFIRFAAFEIGKYADRLGTMSTRFNIGKTPKFTPRDRMHIVLLSDFARAADVYLQSDTFHDEFTKLPDADIVPYWQGSGEDFSFTDISTIDVKTASANNVKVTGVLGVMFDRDALGVTNYNPRVTSHFNEKAEFVNEWHKVDAGYFNDLDENFVLFFVA